MGLYFWSEVVLIIFAVAKNTFLQIPLHTIIEIQMGVAGVQEKRYKLMDAIHPTAGL